MTWVGLEIIKFSEGSQRQISHDVTYVWILKKKIQMNLFRQQKQTHRYRKQTRESRWGENQEFGD